jgi:GT2 family glycosyltransferase/O-antigen/teichoic acid export membrane protein
LSFINRTVFIHTIGVSYLGINGLFASIFSFLSLADLGIGSAIAYSLYDPIVKNDTRKINILMELYGKAYKIIAGVIGITGIALIPFLPRIIKHMPDIPYLRIFYLLMLSCTVASYLFSYKRTMVLCDQKAYINEKNVYQFTIMQTLLQILLLVVTKKYVLYLVTATVCTVISNISISIKVNKIYPFLKEKTNEKLDEGTKKVITKNIIAMVLHKISGIVVYSSDNIIISTFIGINMVGIYSNYYMIMQLISNILGRMFNAITASVANLLVVGSLEDKRKNFDSIYFLNFWMITQCTVCFYFLLDPFITLWIGKDYLLNRLTTVLLVIWFYNQSMRYTVGVFKNTAGLYWNDRFKPIFESLINLVFSIILLNRFGIAGVFMGTLISLITTSLWVEPYIVYKHVLKQKFIKFFITYTVYIAVCGLEVMLVHLLCIPFTEVTIRNFIITFMICLLIPNVTIPLLFLKTQRLRNAINYTKPIHQNLEKLKDMVRLKERQLINQYVKEKSSLEIGDRNMEQIKVGIVVVTYNRREILKDTLEHIRNQTYRNFTVFIIDNASTDGTGTYMRAFTKDNSSFHYYKLKRNLGGSGGFYHGIKLAYQSGVDYIWGMDDDAWAKPEALKVLVETIGGLEGKTCLVSDTSQNRKKNEPTERLRRENRIIPQKTFMFLGFFIPKQLVEDIGYPRKDLFLYFDDFDYSKRAVKAGYQIYRVKDSILEHPDMMQETKKFTLMGKKFTIQKMPEWKWYYYMRNGILIYPKKERDSRLFRKYHLKTLVGVMIAYPKCFPAALAGYIDGKRGVEGKSKRYPK